MAKESAASAGKEKKGAKKKDKRVVPHGLAHIQASFNNTLVAISDPEGNVLTWSSAGRIGFKGSRKGTPFAAQVAAQSAGNQAKDMGMRSVDVQVRGLGFNALSDKAIAASKTAKCAKAFFAWGVTPIPHNGCRARKRRRV